MFMVDGLSGIARPVGEIYLQSSIRTIGLGTYVSIVSTSTLMDAVDSQAS